MEAILVFMVSFATLLTVISSERNSWKRFEPSPQNEQLPDRSTGGSLQRHHRGQSLNPIQAFLSLLVKKHSKTAKTLNIKIITITILEFMKIIYWTA